jgi:hypothetical protein
VRRPPQAVGGRLQAADLLVAGRDGGLQHGDGRVLEVAGLLHGGRLQPQHGRLAGVGLVALQDGRPRLGLQVFLLPHEPHHEDDQRRPVFAEAAGHLAAGHAELGLVTAAYLVGAHHLLDLAEAEGVPLELQHDRPERRPDLGVLAVDERPHLGGQADEDLVGHALPETRVEVGHRPGHQ